MTRITKGTLEIWRAVTGSLSVCVVLAATPSALHAAPTQYLYDDLGRITRAIEWDGSSTQYAYDSTGNATSIVRTRANSVNGSLAINGTPTSVSLAASQNTWLSFTATAGQNIILNVNSIVTSPANASVSMYVLNSSGALIGSASSTTNPTLNLQNLAAGTYNLMIVANNATSATMQASATGSTTQPPADDTSGDVPTLPEWAAIILGLLLLAQVNRKGFKRTATVRRN